MGTDLENSPDLDPYLGNGWTHYVMLSWLTQAHKLNSNSQVLLPGRDRPRPYNKACVEIDWISPLIQNHQVSKLPAGNASVAGGFGMTLFPRLRPVSYYPSLVATESCFRYSTIDWSIGKGNLGIQDFVLSSGVKELPCFEKKSAIFIDSLRGLERNYLLAVYRLRGVANPTLTRLTYSLSRPVIG